jgi:hypothetical protein
VALSIPMDPKAVSWRSDGMGMLGTGPEIDYSHSFSDGQLAQKFADRLTLTTVAFDRSESALLGLVEFARWADTQPLFQPMPDPLREVILRAASPKPQRAVNWDKWRLIPRLPLWKAACLSCGEEPRDSMLGEMRLRGGSLIPHLRRLGERLEILQANLSMDGPIRPEGALYAGMLEDPKCQVLLSDVAAFLMANGADIPAEMQAVGLPKGDESTAENTLPESQPVKTGPILKKAALIRKYSGQWPSAESDLNHSDENGLRAAAKAPLHGEWYEDHCLAWARQRGKLSEGSSAKTARLEDLPRKTHRMSDDD